MTKIVGILNITPDSFSDGGKFFSEENALKQAQKMIDEGVDIIDVGAQSTRPNAEIISQKEEISRLSSIIPQIVNLVKQNRQNRQKIGKKIELSIDSYNFETIKSAFEQGFEIINDVSGLVDEKIIDFVAKNNIKTVLMHSLSVPANPEIIINRALNVVDEILNWAYQKIEFLQKKGVKKEQLIFDPGIGFSKDSQQSIRILKNIHRFQDLGVEIYVGHSKKRFLDDIFKEKSLDFIDLMLKKDFDFDVFDEKYFNKNQEYNLQNQENLMEIRAKKTLMISSFLVRNNIDFIRVHDVLEHKKLIDKINKK